MSQLQYQLASQGVVVVGMEHREGSGPCSFYRLDRTPVSSSIFFCREVGGEVVRVPHRLSSPSTAPAPTPEPREMDAELGEYGLRSNQIQFRAKEIHLALALLTKIQVVYVWLFV